MRRGTNLTAVGDFNQTVVLDLIRRSEEGISRLEIADQSGLARQTVSNVTARLLEENLIEEAGRPIVGRGKPATLFRLCPQSRYAIGINLEPALVTYLVLDLRGEVVTQTVDQLPDLRDPDAAVRTMAMNVSELLAANGLDAAHVLGIGLAVPGPIDSANGLVRKAPYLPTWHDVPLRDTLAQLTGLPVVMELNVTAAVVAEQWVNPAAQASEFAFVYVGSGIGIGLGLGGEAYRGATGNAGQGGTLIAPSKDLPRRRKSDMIGHLVAPNYLVEQAVEAGVLTARPGGASVLDDQFADLVAAAEAGDRKALAIFARAARILAAGVISVANLLDIERVVFGGPAWPLMGPLVGEAIQEHVRSSGDHLAGTEITFDDAAVGVDVVAVGAGCLVLDTLLSPRLSALLLAD